MRRIATKGLHYVLGVTGEMLVPAHKSRTVRPRDLAAARGPICIPTSKPIASDRKDCARWPRRRRFV